MCFQIIPFCLPTHTSSESAAPGPNVNKLVLHSPLNQEHAVILFIFLCPVDYVFVLLLIHLTISVGTSVT